MRTTAGEWRPATVDRLAVPESELETDLGNLGVELRQLEGGLFPLDEQGFNVQRVEGFELRLQFRPFWMTPFPGATLFRLFAPLVLLGAIIIERYHTNRRNSAATVVSANL